MIKIQCTDLLNLAIVGLWVMIFPPMAFSTDNKGAASQPSQTNSNVTCSEWEKHLGKEGICTVQTESGLWEINYYREGKPRYSFKKGELKNLVLLFHPKDTSHKFFDWWPEVVGPGKAIDTHKYVVLSLGILGDGAPKKGNPMLLTMDALVEVQWEVLNFFYPNAKVLLAGGPSLGGDNAVQWAYKYPGVAKKIFGVGGFYHSTISGITPTSEDSEQGPVIKAIMGVNAQEMVKGPYQFWSNEIKLKWWGEISLIGINRTYNDDFYRNPENMKEEGLDPKNFKDPKQFKDLVIQSWATWYMNNVEPHWYGAQLNLFYQIKTSNELAKNLPNEILDIRIRQDDSDDLKMVKENRENLKKLDKKVVSVDVDDAKGHLACCQPKDMNKGIIKAIKDFID